MEWKYRDSNVGLTNKDNIYLYTDAKVKTQWGNVMELHSIPEPKNIVKKLNEILGKNQIRD